MTRPLKRTITYKILIAILAFMLVAQHLFGMMAFKSYYYDKHMMVEDVNNGFYYTFEKLFLSGECFQCLELIKNAGSKGHLASANFYNGIANNYPEYISQLSVSANYPSISPDPNYLKLISSLSLQ